MIIRSLYLYIPVWIAFIYNTIVLSKVVSYVKKVSEKNEWKSFQKLQFYPLVLLICYTGVTFKMIYNYIYDENNMIIQEV